MPSPTDRRARLLACLALVTLGSSVLEAQPQSMAGNDGEMQPGMVMDRRPSAPVLDEVGYAGLLTTDHRASDTIIAAHRSLPVSSFAEVTSLATGRTIVVRIAAQNALEKGRTIDLSCGAARQLGLSILPAPIRVRRVTPPEQEQTILNAGKSVTERLPSPPGLLAALRRKLPPAPRATGNVEGSECGLVASAGSVEADTPQQATPRAPKPNRTVKQPVPAPQKPAAPERPTPPPPAVAAKGPGFAIQVAALSNRAKASGLARTLGGYVESGNGIFRVRKGPYATEAAARAAIPQIRAKGFADARVITNEGR